jgi:hypothetical protein
MYRFLYTTSVLIVLAAWASGQNNSSGLLAAERLHLYQPNRELLEQLVQHSLELATLDGPVVRAKACHEATKALGRAMKDASERDDADRVAELSEHLVAVIQHGLLPTIDSANRTIPMGSQSGDLIQLTREANVDVENIYLSMRQTGKVGTSSRVNGTREQLMAVWKSLGERNRSK